MNIRQFVFLIIVSITFFFNRTYGQITLTGKEHLINNYSEAVGKNVTFFFDDDDMDYLFVIKDEKMKKITKALDKIEINGFVKGLNEWLVVGIENHKKKNFLHVFQKRNDMYILLDGKDFVPKMRYFKVYDNLLDKLNTQNTYLNRVAFSNILSGKTAPTALLCDTACQIKWTGYKFFDDTIKFYYSYVGGKQVSTDNTYEFPASHITQDLFVNKDFIEDCLLMEQNHKDSLEDEKLHAFLVCQKPQGDCDTIFLFNSIQGWHHNDIRNVITPTNDVILFAPDSNYSQMNYEEYIVYVKRRGNKGEMLRRNLAKQADSVNSVGYTLYMQHLREEREREREQEIANQNDPFLAKPRINEKNKKFSSKSAVVTNIKGWEYNKDTGKWMGSMNHIGGSSSFLSCKSLQLCLFYYNDQKYYVLKITVSGGEWRYPTLGIDFIPYNEYYLYIFDENDINSLKTPEELASLVPSRGTYNYENYNEQHTENMIVRELEGHISPNKGNFMWVQKSGNYIRFNFHTISTYEHYDTLFRNEVSSSYFEVPVSEWRKLFAIVK